MNILGRRRNFAVHTCMRCQSMSLLYADWCHVITASLPRPLTRRYSTPANGLAMSAVLCWIMFSDRKLVQIYSEVLHVNSNVTLRTHISPTHHHCRVVAYLAAFRQLRSIRRCLPQRVLTHWSMLWSSARSTTKAISVGRGLRSSSAEAAVSSATPTRFLSAMRRSDHISAIFTSCGCHSGSSSVCVSWLTAVTTARRRWERTTFTVAATSVLPTHTRCLVHLEINLGWPCTHSQSPLDGHGTVYRYPPWPCRHWPLSDESWNILVHSAHWST